MRTSNASYRDMQLLHEIALTPHATQRDLSKRVGVALGLTNLMLRRLSNKGHIKIRNAKGRRIRYLITPQGILEKSRLTVEFIQYSLHLYRGIRRYLIEQLSDQQKLGRGRILLWGTDELAEIATLTIQGMGLELMGVVGDALGQTHFLGYPIRKIEEVPPEEYDCLVLAYLEPPRQVLCRLSELGIPLERITTLSQPRQSVPEWAPTGVAVHE
ncbi:MAG: winged helix-turn-helix transcriptional regulator [Candidatus Omnitrophica bacterium]|nr:winged helix-turn-helix transcriptional regulator [Candidatus Omnitrophota bacterium]